ncbi:MAG: AraC family transcriptional regulator [Pseudobutyrivibrio sp.]|nr:AraC family transcriptional regulator [Pseudobutyrivibrio sp.]
MKKDDLIKYLSTLYKATYMPIIYYAKGEIVCSYASVELPDELILDAIKGLQDTTKPYQYFNTSENLYFGVAKDKRNSLIVIGPVANVRPSNETIHSIIQKHTLSIESYSTIREYFDRTPTFSFSQFINILGLLNKELNGVTIDMISDLDIVNDSKMNEIAHKHTNELYDIKENEKFHNTYYFEQEYYGFVEQGDIEGLKKLIKNVPTFTEGIIANDPLRQAKNIFISSIAIATRKAIAGGLDIETAYLLSDSYIQEVERMTNASAVTMLSATAIIDFTNRVADNKMPSGMSSDIFKAMQYIANHINQNISVEEIADHLKMDRTTLSKKFKRELGFNISEFIMRKKIEEAKSLLSHSDKTISEISEYLCFSSQSYFQNVFKKKYGMTPKEFRNKKI